MRIGDLRQRVTIQTMTQGSDSSGGTTRTPSTLVSNLPASVLPLAGQEAVAAAQQRSELRTRVTIRYRDDVSVKDRIVFGTRTLEIGSIADPDGRRWQLDLICAEVAA